MTTITRPVTRTASAPAPRPLGDMGVPPGPDLRSRLAHLYRRAGFGASGAQLDAAEAQGYEATVEEMLTAPDPAAGAIAPPSLTPPNLMGLPSEILQLEGVALVSWWIERMTVSQVPLREKLPFFWHGLLTSSLQKVGWPSLMLNQNQLFRNLGWGNFEDLLQAVTIDPAMLIWLDGLNSHKSSPNENYGREVMELFSLGRGNYSEDDVKAAARSFTGYRIDTSNPMAPTIVFDPNRWDSGAKTFLGQTGNWDTQDVIRIITEHPACPPYVASRVWSFFAWPIGPDHPIAVELGASFAADLDITGLLRETFLHPQFDSPDARQGLVESPVEWLVRSLRMLQLPGNAITASSLINLQQVPFMPPHVAGWAPNGYWINTASELERLKLAQTAAFLGNTWSVVSTGPADRPAAAAALLGVDAWSPRTEAALANASNDPMSVVALALGSPEYLLG